MNDIKNTTSDEIDHALLMSTYQMRRLEIQRLIDKGPSMSSAEINQLKDALNVINHIYDSCDYFLRHGKTPMTMTDPPPQSPPTPKEPMPFADEVGSAAEDLYSAACAVMRYHLCNTNVWTNLENATMRYNAAQQAARNAALLR